MVNSVFEHTIDSNLTVSQAIDKGLSFLATAQLPNGGFTCLVSQATYGLNEDMLEFEEGDRKGWVSVDNLIIFPPVLIGFSLSHICNNPIAIKILKKIEDFLLNERKIFDLWNNYQSSSYVYNYLPHDIDDTACALAFLRERKRYISNHTDILYANRNDKGLFYTWFCFRKSVKFSIKYWIASCKELRHPIQTKKHWSISENSRYDIDAVVNANVVYYLGESNETRKPIEFIIDQILAGREDSFDGYYRNPIAAYYFISKCFAKGIHSFDAIREVVSKRIVDKISSEGSINNNTLDTALGISALMNLQFHIPENMKQKMISYLISKQLPSGAWPKRVLYSAGIQFVYGWGSEELTTGIVLEALQRLENYSPNA